MAKRLLVILTFMIFTPGAVYAALFGVTQTDLVIIDSSMPSNVTIVGAHNLGAEFTLIFNLAYNPANDTLFGYAKANATTGDQFLVSFSRTTGESTLEENLGNPSAVGFIETLEYVDSLDSLVASTNPLGIGQSRDLVLLDSGVTTPPLTSTTLDNDFGVYDSLNDKFYTTDPNVVNQLVEVDLGTGLHTNIGDISLAQGDMAFQVADGNIYGLSELGSTDNDLYLLDTTNGGAPLSVSLIGAIAGDKVTGIAFAPAPIPEPSTMLLFGTGVLGLIGYRSRRKQEGR